MKKYKVLALLTACITMLSGCSLVSVDEERVANQIVATVNGAEIYRYEVMQDIDVLIDMYVSNGIVGNTDEEKDALRENLINNMYDNLILQEVLYQKAAELGIALSDEEKQEKQTQADEYFASIKESIRDEVEEELGLNTDEEAEGQESEDAVDDTIVETMVTERYADYIENENTPEAYYETLLDTALTGKIEEYITDKAEVTDEDTQNWYDQMLDIQQTEMDVDAAAFETQVYDGHIYTYVPQDTVAVKQVFLAFEDEDLVNEAQGLYDEGDTDAAFELLAPEIEKLTETAQEIKQKLEDGEDIDTLIEEYGEDPGMTQAPTSKYGYLVESRTDTYVAEFKEAALKLKNVGDISDPVTSYMGIHILQCVNVYKQGVIAYEDLYEDIKEALLPGKQQEVYDETTQAWIDEADIVYYKDKLFNG